MNEHSSPCSVYRYYDQFDTLIYVGITGRGTKRNLEHSRKARWWPYVAYQDVEHLPARAAALKREAELIAALHPPFNVQHNGAHAGNADGYIRSMSNVPVNETFDEQYQRLNKQLPLNVLNPDAEDGRITFATTLECWKVAARLEFSPGLRFQGPNGMGKVTGMHRAGPLMLIETRFHKQQRTITSAYARIARPTLKKDSPVMLRAIVCDAISPRRDDPFGVMSDRLRSAS